MISLRSRITQKILNLFFLNEKERFYVNELAKEIKEDPKNVYRKLIDFNKEGILLDEFQGKERYFFLNKKYPFLKEYKKIILKGVGFEKILKDKLKTLKGIESAYIFGSYTQNSLSAESDIDILVVGDFDGFKFQKIILDIQKLTGREINPIELTKKEFEDKAREKDPFLKDVFSKKYIKILWGLIIDFFIGITLVAFSGYKIKSRTGHHIKILEKLSQIVGNKDIEIIGNKMRKKRNLDLYEGGIIISSKEAMAYLNFVKEVINKAEKYLKSQSSLF